ncbi:MAG: peptidylprolyl isomerase [Candidatus Bathyarchaeia archaeon]
MSTIKHGSIVKLHYVAKLENGQVLESTNGRDPIKFKVGAGEALKGLDESIIGLKKGDKVEIAIPPEKGFGRWRNDLLKKIPRSVLKGDSEPQVGMIVELKSELGGSIPAIITEVDEKSVTIDLNHPLAGQTLEFELEIIDVE